MTVVLCEGIRTALAKVTREVAEDPGYLEDILNAGIICKLCGSVLDIHTDENSQIIPTDFRAGYSCIFPNR